MISSQNISDKARIVLQDDTNVRWSVPEMAKWINAGCKELVLLKPSTLTANVAMKLRPGTKQTLIGATFVDDASPVTISPIQLMEVVRNMGSDGANLSGGRAIRGLARRVLDRTEALWHSRTPSAEVLHFIYDPVDQKTFYVYPAVPTTPDVYVEVVVSKSPTNSLLDSATTLGTNDIDPGIDDIYEMALVDYVLYRAYSKDIDFAENASRAQWHYKSFHDALGIKMKNEFTMVPSKSYDNKEEDTQPKV